MRKAKGLSRVLGLRSSFLLLFIFILSALAAACTSGVQAGDPALPPGFVDAGVPDVDLSAYVYLAQESPTTIPLKVFGDSAQLPPGGASTSVQANWLMAFLGPSVEDFGGRLQFGDEAAARLVGQVLAGAPSDQPLWHGAFGSEVRLVRSAAPWAGDATAALEQARMVSLKDKYPDTWETMRLLPAEAPQMKPMAAGFFRNAVEMVRPLLDRQGVDGAAVSSALGFARVDTVAFAVYADRPVQLPPEVTEQYFQSLNVRAIAVARAGYPGFLVSFLFGSFAGRAGLEDVEVDGEQVKYRELDDNLHLMVKNFGNVLYFAVGTTQKAAHDTMKAIIQNMRA